MDTYFFLFIAFTILIFHIESMLKTRGVSEFLFRTKELGLSDGTYALAVQSLSFVTILFPFFWIKNFDLNAFFMLVIGLFVIYSIIHRLLFDERVRFITFEKSIKNEGPSEIRLKSIFYISSNILHVFVHLLIVSYLCSFFYPTQHLLSFSLFTIFTFSFFGLGGAYSQQKINVLIFFILYFLLVSVIFIFYLKFGTQTVLENYQSNHLQLFQFNFLQQIQSIVMFVLVTLGSIISNEQFFNSLQAINQKHRLSAVRFSSFSVSALYFAMAVLTIFYVGQFENLSAQELIEKHPLTIQIIVLITFSIMSIGIGHSFFSIVKGISVAIDGGKNSFSKRHIQTLYGTELIGIIVLSIFAFLNTSSIQVWLNIWIVVISSIAVSFIFFLTHRKRSENGAIKASIISMSIGWIVAIIYIDTMKALAITIIVSSVLHVGVVKFKIFTKVNNSAK